MNKNDWHYWFAWYPVSTFEYGVVWLRTVIRKKIPAEYFAKGEAGIFQPPGEFKLISWGISESLTGYWHRIPDYW